MGIGDLLRFDGKRVLVTGGSSGMGEATVGLLNEQGAEVHVLDVKAPAQDVASFHEIDLREIDLVDAAVDVIGGPLDVVVNCAGVAPVFGKLDVLLINFCAARHLTDRVIDRYMPDGGVVGSIASVAGRGWRDNLPALCELIGAPDYSSAAAWCEAHPDALDNAYGWSKQALIVYSMLRAVELKERHIRLNTLSPGATATPLMPDFVRGVGQAVFDSVGEIAGRSSQAVEQARPLVFLLSDAASYVNGANLDVDGGFLADLATRER